MKNEELKIFDKKDRLVLTSLFPKNRTFRTSISITEAGCLNVIPYSKSLLWHRRYVHLNFKSLSSLTSKEAGKEYT